MEECALCGKLARMLCESDQAKLCWDCDRKVHGANFLVAKHTRILLCRLCQSPTPWKASGPTLTPTHSLCHRCVPIPNHNPHAHADIDADDVHDYASDDDDDDDDSEPEQEEEEEEGENQVVPWSSASPTLPLPPASSTNSDADGDISSATGGGASRLPFKRSADNSFNDNSDVRDFFSLVNSFFFDRGVVFSLLFLYFLITARKGQISFQF